jgi:galactokinase
MTSHPQGPDSLVRASAPGRVNLIGDHTDYNGGFVLPMAIPQRTWVELRPRADDLVRVWSRELGCSAEYRLGQERRRGDWLDYVMGCTQVLRAAGHLGQDGRQVAGVDLRISTDLPLGGGLSSSASLSVALLRALRQAFALVIDDLQIALLGQQAETQLVGAPVGVMDPLCASLGEPGVALLIDARSLAIRRVPLPAGLDLIVIGSGIAHAHASGGYRTRRAECEEAARLLEVESLRELGCEFGPDLLARIARLPAPLDRRVRHVVSENQRVLASVAAIEQGRLRELGPLFADSHASMRDDFEVSVAAVDRLVTLALALPGVFAARLTGGGFGGSIVALADAGRSGPTAAEQAEQIVASYAAETGEQARVLLAGPAHPGSGPGLAMPGSE